MSEQPQSRGVGRPPLIEDEELVAEILDNIRAGNTQERSAIAAGISESTFYKWKQRAERELTRRTTGHPPDSHEEPYVQFIQELAIADAQAETAIISEIRQEPGGGKWIAPRRWPERWSQTSRVQATVSVQKARDALDSLPPELRSQVEALLSQRVGAETEADDDSDS